MTHEREPDLSVPGIPRVYRSAITGEVVEVVAPFANLALVVLVLERDAL